jgi:hypothetical protein
VIFVVINAALSLMVARRTRSLAFGAGRGRGPGPSSTSRSCWWGNWLTGGGVPMGNAIFFVLLMRLITLLDDRFRPRQVRSIAAHSGLAAKPRGHRGNKGIDTPRPEGVSVPVAARFGPVDLEKCPAIERLEAYTPAVGVSILESGMCIARTVLLAEVGVSGMSRSAGSSASLRRDGMTA